MRACSDDRVRGVKSADEVEIFIKTEGAGLDTLKRFGESRTRFDVGIEFAHDLVQSVTCL